MFKTSKFVSKIAATVVAAGVMVAAASVAHAVPIGLGLVIDGSGSISGANFTAQKNGYVAALERFRF